MIELLAPAGNFDCLKAAVQNGADAVYFGGGNFNARNSANNFVGSELKEAIQYAKLRNVKINFTLNTLIKNDEFSDAINLAERVYELGCDAVIVQDLGLAKYIIKNLPGMDVHASTQMTIHNLEGVNALEKLGFARVVLSRELSLHEIEYICSHTKLEVETFIHGALCISYSGQCLFSSMVGGRSGNRGKCAQPCRLPYELLEISSPDSANNDAMNSEAMNSDAMNSDAMNLIKLSNANSNSEFINASSKAEFISSSKSAAFNRTNNKTKININNKIKTDDKIIDRGYLLSPKDLCGLNYIPSLIKAGVKSLKIEGRLKSPTYVATVTRIYRKYIDLAYSDQPYVVDPADIRELAQAFNRGGFSDGNFDSEPNKDYVFTEKSNNTGLFAGTISSVNAKRGLVSFKTQEPLAIGDKVLVEHEDTKYTISEMMLNNKNIKSAKPSNLITIGRLKGNIHSGDKIYKISDYATFDQVEKSLNIERKKIPLSAIVNIHIGEPISLEVTSQDDSGNYFSMSSEKTLDIIPDEATNYALTIDKVKAQLTKTTDTPFEFKYIKVNMDENVHLPKLSALNQLRRECIADLQQQAIKRFERKIDASSTETAIATINAKLPITSSLLTAIKNKKQKVAIYFDELNTNYDYSVLKKFDYAYVPYMYAIDDKYQKAITEISNKAKIYFAMPTVLKDNYRNIFFNHFEDTAKKFGTKGILITNLGCIDFFKDLKKKYEIIANYNLNIFNSNSLEELKKLGVQRFTLSPELDEGNLKLLATTSPIQSELIVYGKIPLMTIGYCPLGSCNKCHPHCDMKCRSGNKYYLKDRLGLKFRIIPDNVQTITTIYNSKTNSINYSNINPDVVRISVLDESVEDINNIISNVKEDKIFSGSEFTTGNLKRFV